MTSRPAPTQVPRPTRPPTFRPRKPARLLRETLGFPELLFLPFLFLFLYPLLLPAPAAAQSLEALHAGAVANAAEELLVVGPEIDRAAPGDLVFAVGEGFGDDAGAIRVQIGAGEVLPLPEPLFEPGVVAFVVPLWAEGEVEVRLRVGETTTRSRTLRVETPPELRAPDGYARHTLQAALALTFLLEGEVRLAAEAGVPLDVELHAGSLEGHRRALLEALEQLGEMPPEQVRRLDEELHAANALERLQRSARELARRGPDCDDVERFAGHAANGLSAAGSIVGGCVPGGECIGGILSGLGNVASSVQAEAARACARKKEEEEKKRWEDLFGDLEELKEGQAKLEGKMDRLEAKVDGIDAKVDRLESKLDAVERKLDRLERKVDEQAQALAKLEAKADKIERKLDRQEKKLDSLEIKLDRLEIKADKVEKKLDRIEAKLDRQEKKLDRLEKKLDAQEKKLDRQEKKLDAQEKKLDKQEAKLDRLEKKLDGGGGGGGSPQPGEWDFGDAPDGGGATSYPPPAAQEGRFPSLRDSPNGASGHGIRHRVAPAGTGDRIGVNVTGEPEARLVDRDVDDLPMAPGGAAGDRLLTDRRGTVEMAILADAAEAGPRHLNVLCDLNRDGDWADDGEWVVENREVSLDAAGAFERFQAVEVEVDPSGGLQPGLYWVRVSLTRPALPGPTWDGSGPAEGYEHGETEDFLLEVR